MTDPTMGDAHPDLSLPDAERRGVYHAIYTRRDIRREFLPDPVPNDILIRLLKAAHHAPSVGFMQPWNFILIENPVVRQELKRVVDKERRAAAIVFESPRSEKFLSLKVEAILDAPVLIGVTIDPAREGPFVLGRLSDPDTDVYSASCAIMNLWLAARAEGIGMGWVTIFRREDVQGILNLPYHVKPIGLLCLGYVREFPRKPMLETEEWAYRQPLSKHVFVDGWGKQEGSFWQSISEDLDRKDVWPWEL